MNIQNTEEQESLISEEVAHFLAASHNALVGLVPVNPRLSNTEELEIIPRSS